jgi:hypothetical protein
MQKEKDKLRLKFKNYLSNKFFGDFELIHLLVYFIPLIPVIGFYLYASAYHLFDALLGVEFYYDPDLLIELFFNVNDLVLGPTQFNPLIVIWNLLLFAIWALILFNALIIAPLLLLFIVFQVLSAPFKKEFLQGLGEFFMGLFLGATLYLVVAALSADDANIWRTLGAMLGFIASVSFLVYSVSYG